MELSEAVDGCILGTAVGDATGLCYEGLSRQRLSRMVPDIDGPRLLFGRGMISDDTEHTCMVAQSLIVSGGNVLLFRNSLSRQLRFWLLALPAGTGLATLRATLRLWFGAPPDRSGVFSAGNGPAMRSALLGVCHGSDPSLLRELVRASTRITHTDPKAEYGALAVAAAAHRAFRYPDEAPIDYVRALECLLAADGKELLALISRAVESAERQESTQEFATELGLGRGVGGYVYHTVPVALHAWFRYGRDYRAAILAVIACGGDTDTTAAITGAIIGAGVGRTGIPPDWLARVWEWPRGVLWMTQLGERLAEACERGERGEPLRAPIAGILARNILFLAVVLAHGFRRLLPPYGRS